MTVVYLRSAPRPSGRWVPTPPDDLARRDALTARCPIDPPTQQLTPVADKPHQGAVTGVAPDRVLAWLLGTLAGTALCLWLLMLGAPIDAAGLITLAAALAAASVPVWREVTL